MIYSCLLYTQEVHTDETEVFKLSAYTDAQQENSFPNLIMESNFQLMNNVAMKSEKMFMQTKHGKIHNSERTSAGSSIRATELL